MTFFAQAVTNPSKLIEFISIYNDDYISESIDNEIFQLVYYGRLNLSDILYEMTFEDRQRWLAMTKAEIEKKANINNNQLSVDDPMIVHRINQMNFNDKNGV